MWWVKMCDNKETEKQCGKRKSRGLTESWLEGKNGREKQIEIQECA